MRSFYQILEISVTADETEIRKAYHKLAGLHHPDKGGDTKKFEEIKRAYDVLRDESCRKTYDEKIKKTVERFSKNSSDKVFQKSNYTENREEELKRIFNDPHYMQHHYFTPRYRKSEETERAKRAKQRRCPVCHGRGFVRYNVRPELGSIGIEERLCSCQIVTP